LGDLLERLLDLPPGWIGLIRKNFAKELHNLAFQSRYPLFFGLPAPFFSRWIVNILHITSSSCCSEEPLHHIIHRYGRT
jgi:hypothetical protein